MLLVILSLTYCTLFFVFLYIFCVVLTIEVELILMKYVILKIKAEIEQAHLSLYRVLGKKNWAIQGKGRGGGASKLVSNAGTMFTTSVYILRVLCFPQSSQASSIGSFAI